MAWLLPFGVVATVVALFLGCVIAVYVRARVLQLHPLNNKQGNVAML